jgi:predicted aspartyl protease
MKLLLSLTLSILSFSSFAGVTEWIDFKLEGGHVKIPVVVAGVETFAMLDTGAQINAINKAFVNKNKLSFDKGRDVRIRGVFGTQKQPSYNNVPINFFGIDTELDKLVQTSLGFHTTGLLFGAGFFDKFIVQLDYPNQKMRLVGRDALSVDEFKNIEIQRQKGTGMPIVKIRLPDEKHLWLLLDTGNSGGMVVERKVALNMGWLEGVDSRQSLSMGANSIAVTESFRIPQLGFGPFDLENVLVTIPAEGEKSNLESQYQRTGSRIKGRRVQGIIGYDVLKHFLITIDYNKGLAHIGLPEETSE